MNDARICFTVSTAAAAVGVKQRPVNNLGGLCVHRLGRLQHPVRTSLQKKKLGNPDVSGWLVVSCSNACVGLCPTKSTVNFSRRTSSAYLAKIAYVADASKPEKSDTNRCCWGSSEIESAAPATSHSDINVVELRPSACWEFACFSDSSDGLASATSRATATCAALVCRHKKGGSTIQPSTHGIYPRISMNSATHLRDIVTRGLLRGQLASYFQKMC